MWIKMRHQTTHHFFAGSQETCSNRQNMWATLEINLFYLERSDLPSCMEISFDLSIVWQTYPTPICGSYLRRLLKVCRLELRLVRWDCKCWVLNGTYFGTTYDDKSRSEIVLMSNPKRLESEPSIPKSLVAVGIAEVRFSSLCLL